MCRSRGCFPYRSGIARWSSRSKRPSAQSSLLGSTRRRKGRRSACVFPNSNEQRRKDMVKVAHKYAEAARVAARHVRRDALDILKKLEKDGDMSEDDAARNSDVVQKETDKTIAEIDLSLVAKEKEIMHV